MSQTRVLPEPFHRQHTLQIHDFNVELQAVGLRPLRTHNRELSVRVGRLASRTSAFRFYGNEPRRTFFTSMMWPSAARLFPYGLRNAVVPFIYDCWPDDYDQWERLLGRLRIPVAFFTSRASAAYFADRNVASEVHWLAEAVDVHRYIGRVPLRDRPTSVLEIGRRYDAAHDAIRAALSQGGFTHRFSDGKTLFETREDLIAGLHQSAVLVCYPKSTTHPRKAGGLETATLRYFEAMAAGCLIVGKAPGELIDLCGYNPVIELDAGQIGASLPDILRFDQTRFQQLVDRNQEWVEAHGSWRARAQQVHRVLSRASVV